MKTVFDSRIFVDTNILYYSNNPSDVFGQQSIERVNELSSQNNELLISPQILREYANATLRNAIFQKLDLKSSIEDVIWNIARFRRDFEVLPESPEVFENWLRLLPALTTNRDIFDFNIAATLQAHQISHILTHNVSDFSKFSSWLTVLPLIA